MTFLADSISDSSFIVKFSINFISRFILYSFIVKEIIKYHNKKIITINDIKIYSFFIFL